MKDAETKQQDLPLQKELSVDQIKQMSLNEKIFYIMAEMPSLKKTGKHSYGGYNYVPHDSVTNEIRKMFVKYRMIAIPSVTRSIRDSGVTFVDVDLEILNIDKQESRVIKCSGTCVLDSDKAYGAALSYAMKYGYLKLFHIETGEMDTDDNKDDKVYDPSKMGDYLMEMFERLNYTPEKLRNVWENNEKNWKLVEERAKKSAKKQEAENKSKGKK